MVSRFSTAKGSTERTSPVWAEHWCSFRRQSFLKEALQSGKSQMFMELLRWPGLTHAPSRGSTHACVLSSLIRAHAHSNNFSRERERKTAYSFYASAGLRCLTFISRLFCRSANFYKKSVRNIPIDDDYNNYM